MKKVKHGSTSFGTGGHGGGDSLPTQHFAGAERTDPFRANPEAGHRFSRAGSSKEYILPKPKGGIHVREDVMVESD